MTLDDYCTEWDKDAPIPPDDLDASARQVPYLHAKWWRFFVGERLRFRKLEFDLKVLSHNKSQWYGGKMIDEDRVKLGWPPNPLRIAPAAVAKYVETDADVLHMLRQKAQLEEMLRFLEDVIAQINKRSFHINNAIDYLKFKMGQ